MSLTAEDFIVGLERRIEGIIDACTRCGKCADICPTPALAGFGDADPENLATGVIDILKGEVFDPLSEDWARKCCGTGYCIDVCPEGIDARFMLAMARRRLNEAQAPDVRKAEGRQMFKDMSRGVRVLSRLQMPPEVLNRLNPPRNRELQAGPPELLFYTGCNLLKTPHIGLLCLDVLDRLNVRYDVYGGPSNCCGIMQFRPGDTENAGRQAMTTVERFRDTGVSEVLAWCPTCQIQFGEVALPSISSSGEQPFDMNMFPVYLARRLDDLKPMMSEPVRKRIALLEFPGARGVSDAIHELLSAVPGLEVVDLGLRPAGYQITSLAMVADYRDEMLATLFRTAERVKIDTLCSVFHADHRELASHAGEWPFEIANYMELIGASMGLRHEDLFKRLKAMQDADAIVEASAETLHLNGVDPVEARDAVMAYMLGDQLLAIDPAQHPDAAE